MCVWVWVRRIVLSVRIREKQDCMFWKREKERERDLIVTLKANFKATTEWVWCEPLKFAFKSFSMKKKSVSVVRSTDVLLWPFPLLLIELTKLVEISRNINFRLKLKLCEQTLLWITLIAYRSPNSFGNYQILVGPP